MLMTIFCWVKSKIIRGIRIRNTVNTEVFCTYYRKLVRQDGLNSKGK